jgi:monoamine oxidase
MDELGITGDARYLIESSFRDDYGVEPENLSQLFVVHTYGAAYNQPNSGIEIDRIEGGADQVPTALADELGDAVRLGSPVARVEHDGSGVSVTVRGGETFDGDHCVLAAPLPALRPIRFSPALPRPFSEAIARAQYGPISKTLLQYPRRFWRERGLSGYAITDGPAGTTWEASVEQPGREGVLTSYAAGALGLARLKLTDDALAEVVAAGVAEAFGDPVPEPIEAQSVRWPLMPFSGGGYVAWAPGQMSAWYGPLREGTGRLRFAGEHTAELSGYMEGAVRSGRRAAEQIDSA